MMNVKELLMGEYDAVKELNEVTFECYIEYLDETHLVQVQGETIWAFANGHSWVIN